MLEMVTHGGEALSDNIAEAVRIAKASGHMVRFLHNEEYVTASPHGRQQRQRRLLFEGWAEAHGFEVIHRNGKATLRPKGLPPK